MTADKSSERSERGRKKRRRDGRGRRERRRQLELKLSEEDFYEAILEVKKIARIDVPSPAREEMQDFQSITGLRGRILEGSGGRGVGGTEHRLRGFPSSSMTGAPHPPPALKCPRCESSNTKFCYYNNYNLSQPRHFCKSCRRYWTKGGVLRNVPIGGGCRKPKRSSSSKSSSKSSSSNSPSSASSIADKDRPRTSSTSRADFDPDPITISRSENPNPPFDQPNLVSPPPPAADIFADSAVTFPSLVAAAAVANQSIQGFNFVDPPLLRLPDPPPAPPQHPKIEEVRVQGLLHATDLPELPSVGGIDWPAVDSGIFDLSGSTDPATYWNHSHWSDGDPSLYLP
ncbi:hypothetical protein HPP92_019419 [Vanilla planifolia]|uniref:Dof zinc finger protein n=1 Tax=Vanilla planifolia TaxID=51239 RepID=A0A835Q6S1_VANPL|nr:hypothetical protein HPP92_019419 [Vanilla planifolia]